MLKVKQLVEKQAQLCTFVRSSRVHNSAEREDKVTVTVTVTVVYVFSLPEAVSFVKGTYAVVHTYIHTYIHACIHTYIHRK
jgi:hypothetical protein